jgi:predicted MFS family arabinose efflux permease
MARWVGWRYAALVGGLVGAIALAMYPIAIDPYRHPDKWRMLFNLVWSFNQRMYCDYFVALGVMITSGLGEI